MNIKLKISIIAHRTLLHSSRLSSRDKIFSCFPPGFTIDTFIGIFRQLKMSWILEKFLKPGCKLGVWSWRVRIFSKCHEEEWFSPVKKLHHNFCITHGFVQLSSFWIWIKRFPKHVLLINNYLSTFVLFMPSCFPTPPTSSNYNIASPKLNGCKMEGKQLSRRE